MCKEERHLITSIMLGDLVPHGGHQFVYGWYLRHGIRAGILLRLMGRTEGLDCQRGASPHFSYQVSEVTPHHHPSAPPATPNLPVLPSSVNGDRVSWNMEAWKRVSISISFPDKCFFSQHKDLGQPVPNFSVSQRWRQRICCCATFHVWKWGKCRRSASRRPAGAWPDGWMWGDGYIRDYSTETETEIVPFIIKKLLHWLKWNVTLKVIWNVQKCQKAWEESSFQNMAVLRGATGMTVREAALHFAEQCCVCFERPSSICPLLCEDLQP